MEQHKYYPALSTLINPDEIPPALGFLKDQLTDLLDTTFFRALQHSRSGKGGRAFYSLTLLRYERIGFKVPGTEIEVLLNSPASSQFTEIPVTFGYQWGIIDLLGSFKLENFLDDAKQLISLLVRKFDIDPMKVVQQAVDKLAGVPGQLSSLVTAVNTQFGKAIQTPNTGTPEEKLRKVIADIEDEVERNVLDIIYTLYIKPLSDARAALGAVEQLFRDVFDGDSVVAFLKDLLIPKIDASLQVSIDVEFPRSILVPVTADDVPKPEPERSRLSIADANFWFSTTKGIGFDTQVNFSLDRSMIGDTGLIISFENVKLDVSTTTNIPEATADGRGPDFVGVFVGSAEISLPKFWKTKDPAQRPSNQNRWAKIKARNVLIGTGGLSGQFSLETTTDEPVLETWFGGREASPLGPEEKGFGIALDRFDIRFHQGSITHCDIQGMLTIPGMKQGGAPAEIRVTVTIDKTGFRIAGTFPPVTIGIPQILNFTFSKLAIGKLDNRFYLETSGELDIIANIPVLNQRFIEKPMNIQKLVIWSNGEFDVEGGSLVLPTISPLKVGPVELSVTALHFGRDKQPHNGAMREYKVIGFDGGVKSGPGGVDARGEGIKFYFTVDDDQYAGVSHKFLRVETIRIDLRIPGDATPETAALLLKGYISMKNPTSLNAGGAAQTQALTEYAGGVTFRLPRLEMGGGAELRMIPSIGAFLVDAHLEMSTPILLGSTGLGIYGFRGVFGNKYVYERPADLTWWEFYKKPELGVHPEKFTQRDGVSIGAGVSLATAADSGTTFSSKLFFLLSIPSVFMLEGQAAILSKRVGLDTKDDPPFYAMIAIEPGVSVEAGFGARMKIPQESGDVLSLDAALEMGFFFGRSSAWYVNIGRDQPETKRIRAQILRILDGWAYFMLSASGIKAGAGVEWKFEQDCGIAKVGLGASLDVGGRVSFKPVQIGGWINLSGYAELRVFGIGFRLSVKAGLSAEAPHPFVICGYFQLEISTPWPLPDISISVNLCWRFDNQRNVGEVGMLAPPDSSQWNIGTCPPAELKLPAKATHMVTNESFPLNFLKRNYDLRTSPPGTAPYITIPDPTDSQWAGAFNRFAIPVDSWIDIEFTKSVMPNLDNNDIKKLAKPQDGVVNHELVPPQKGNTDQVKHTYKVERVSLYYWSDPVNKWQPYNILQASTPLLDLVAQTNPGLYEANYNQALAWAETQIGDKLKYGFWQLTQAQSLTKLRLLARTAFEQNPYVHLNELGYPPQMLVCAPSPVKFTCLNWVDIPVPYEYPTNQEVFDRKLRFVTTGGNAAVLSNTNSYGITPSLRLGCGDSIEFRFPEPVSHVKMKLSTGCDKLMMSYYKGYAYTPSPAPLGPDGRPTATWSVTPKGPATGVANDDTWDKLRAIPSIIRAFCTGGAPSAGLAPVAALETVMNQKFRKTNIYLRQLWGLTPAATNADFCPRLYEMLELVAIALTGKDVVPQSLKLNIENFYRDAKRHAERYAQLMEEAGTPVAEPPAPQNTFYENWLEVLACLGRIYEKRSSLPVALQDLAKQIALEIEPLYFKVRATVELRSMQLNQWNEIQDPMQRLRMITEFFTLLSLALNSTNIPPALIAEYDPFYQKLDVLAGRIRTTVRTTGSVVGCGSSTGVPTGGGSYSTISGATACDRLKELQSVARLLCGGPPLATAVTTPIINAINVLVNGFADTRATLGTSFGLPADLYTADTCGNLALALASVAFGWAIVEELPGGTRVEIREFHGKLLKLADDYREATENLDLQEPTEETDQFLNTWIETLSCLCRMCAGVQSITDPSERAYFTGTVDPLIDGLFNAISGATQGAGYSLYGTRVPTDNCDLIAAAISTLTALTMNCNLSPAQQTWLTTKVAAFQAAFGDTAPNGFKHGAVAPYHTVLCNGASMNASCGVWIDALECLDNLIERRAYLPAGIIDQIVEDFNGLLLDISNQVFFVYNDLMSWPWFATQIENVQFEVRYILGHIYEDCLRGNGVNPLVLMRLTNGQLADLEERFLALVDALHELEGTERISLCDTPRTSRTQRMRTLVQIYRKLCNTPPTEPNLQTPPLAEIVFALQNNVGLLNDLAAALNLEAPPVGWPLADFTKVMGKVIRLMVMGYSVGDRLSLALESRMNALYQAIKPAADAWMGGSVAPLAGCQTSCDTLLSMLFCLANACRYKRYLPSNVFTTHAQSLQVKLGQHLVDIVKQGMLWGDVLGLEVMPNRGMDRCGKVRIIANYFAARSFNYTSVNMTALRSFFDLHEGLADALNEPNLPGARGRFCPKPGAYDPLRKREKIPAGSLGTPVEYLNPDEPIDRIVISPIGCPGTNCFTYVHEICWLSESDLQYNNDLPDDTVILETNNAVIYGLKMLTQSIWRPNTMYALQIETHEVIDSNTDNPYRTVYTFGFQTNGPVGHFHAYDDPAQSSNPQLNCRYKALKDADNEAQFQYASLKQYVDYQRSYPNADGNIIGAKPLYYVNTKLQLFYVKDYVGSMYAPWRALGSLPETRAGIQVVIRDPGRAADPLYDVVIDPLWRLDTAPHESPDKLIFKYMMSNNGGCLQFDPIQITDKPPARQTKVPISLEPRKLYTAMFNAVMEVGAQARQTREVHKYVFQTSRYAAFADHIESFHLDAANDALYHESVDAADAAMGLSVFTTTRPGGGAATRYDELMAQYADPLDRLIDGALRLGTIPAPATTEITIVKTGSRTLGLLLRSPEPFNDPKLPLEEIAAGLTATTFPGTAVLLFSKDVSRVFITNATMDIPAGAAALEFEYRLYDGAQFGPATTLTNAGTTADPDWQEAPVPPVTLSFTIA